MARYASLAHRLAANIVHADNGCAEWDGNINNRGYGRLSVRCCGRVKKVFAHRVSHEVFIGPIPRGYEVDHKCNNTRCIHPHHLEAVTPAENQRRKFERAGAHHA